MIDNARVIDGQIGRALIKFPSNRIAAGFHRSMNQAIGLGESPSGIVDELFLSHTPVACESFPICFVQRVNAKVLDAFGAMLELAFRGQRAATLFNNTIVFGTESTSEFLRTRLEQHEYGERYGN